VAKIREEDIDDLRERADLVEVVSAYTPLKRSGGNTSKGLCPFHSEKTPSFTVDAAKGLWHCFGCGEGGNVYHFIQKVESLTFPEAVEWLARRFGVDLRYEESRPGEQRTAGIKARLLEANGEAASFWHDLLMSSPQAEPARAYLMARGFGSEVAERWQLGWAPGGNETCRHLLGRRFSVEEIVRADLGRKSERDGNLYDSFRGRIVFPTRTVQGDVAGFGGRALGDVQPKYLNTAETPVFAKSRLLFGLDRAKSAIARGVAVVVEGYTDVIALHEAGVINAVATNGVALGGSHLELLKKFTDRAVLMFDADEAGRAAADRGWGLDRSIGLEVLVAPLPAGRDPAEVVTEDGAESIAKFIEAAQPLVEFKLEQTVAKLPLDTPEARARAVREAVKVLGSQRDVIARHEYAFKVARRIGVDPEAVQRALGDEEAGGLGPDEEAGGRARDRRLPGNVKVEREALQLLLTKPRESAPWAGDVSERNFSSPVRRELFRHATGARAAGAAPASAAVAERLSSEALGLYTELTVGDGGASADAQERMSQVFTRLKVFLLETEIKSRRNTLQEVNPVTDASRHDALFTELVGLEAERRDLLRGLQGGG